MAFDQTKFVSPENLEYFKGKQDAANDAEFANKASIPTKTSQLSNDSGYQTESDVSSLIAQAISSVFKYKGVKQTESELPSSGNEVGDVWHIDDTGAEFAWNGSEWEELGTSVSVTWSSITGKPDVFPPQTHNHTKDQISDLADWAKASTKPSYTYSEVGAASESHTHSPFTGATSSASGQSGFVPAPSAGQNSKFLRGDGSWTDVPVPENMVAMTNEEIDAMF